MTEPKEFDPKTTKTLTFSGKQWPLADLAPRQLRVVRKPLKQMTDRLNTALRGLGADLVKQAGMQADVLLNLTPEEYDELILTPIHQALTRLHPDLKWEEFIDMPTTDGEVIAAWFEARRISGCFIFEDPAVEGKDKTGEAPPAAIPPAPDPTTTGTGTAS